MVRRLLLTLGSVAVLAGCSAPEPPEGRAKVVVICVGIIIGVPLFMLLAAAAIMVWEAALETSSALCEAVWPMVIGYVGGAILLAVGYLNYDNTLMIIGGAVLGVSALTSFLATL